MKNILSTILLALFLVSCVNKESEQATTTLTLDASQAQEVKLSSFVSNVEFLKLSSEQNSYIGEIEKIEVVGDRIYVLDARQSVALYVFDREGTLQFKIANYGQGPGEFIGPYDFAIDEKNGEIIIYDARSLKLCFYNINDGSYIKEINLDFQLMRFTVSGDHFIFFLNNRPSKYNHNILITNRDLQVIDQYLKQSPNMLGYHFSLPVNFSRFEDNTYFTAPSDYNIYRIGAKGTFETYKAVDFGKDALPDSYYKKHRENKSRRAEIGNAAYHVSNYFESDDFLFFRYNKGEERSHFYLESKRNSKIIHADHHKLIDDIGIGPLIVWPNTMIDNTLVWYQNQRTLLRFLHNKKDSLSEMEWAEFVRKNRKLVSFAQTLTEDDNPYLIFMEIDF